MMGFLRKPILLICLFLLFPGIATAAGPERTFQEARGGYFGLRDSGKQKLYRENWDRVIDRLLAFVEDHPDDRRAPDAAFLAGKACSDLYQISLVRRDALRAVELFDALAERYPRDSLADDALMLGARIQEKVLKDYQQAYIRYEKILRLYPSGDMVSRARSRVTGLSSFAQPQESAPGTGEIPAEKVSAEKGDAELTDIRFWSNPGYTRVVINLTERADFTANFLGAEPKEGAPPRIYVDIKGASTAPKLSEPTSVDDGLLRRIRTGTPGGGTVRVVLDLVSFKDYKVFPLEDPFRIIIDVSGGRTPELTVNQPEVRALETGKDEIARVLDQTPAESPVKVKIPSKEAGKALRRIVVDAGHGGKDPGAIGPGGTQEKEVTLAIARALARRLEKDLGCEVILTRNGDVFLPLEERTAIANKVGADLFISVHANASPNHNAYGIETYYLNFSKNDQATAVVARENGTSLKQVGDLELILFDLMANSKINESSRLAAEIQKSLVENLGTRYRDIKDLGVRQGPFYVLLGATMPSVLVETAFLSNKREESRLTDSRYHENTVAAIAQGVRNYATALKLIATK